jgi:hypothetical protein
MCPVNRLNGLCSKLDKSYEHDVGFWRKISLEVLISGKRRKET